MCHRICQLILVVAVARRIVNAGVLMHLQCVLGVYAMINVARDKALPRGRTERARHPHPIEQCRPKPRRSNAVAERRQLS